MINVTHDQVEAMTMADRIVVLRDGGIEQVGAPMDLYRDPDDRFVAGFIGSPAMKFLECDVVDGSVRHPGLTGSIPVTNGVPADAQEVILGTVRNTSWSTALATPAPSI